tara:strand:+ start:321 stop:449 length:129 start_codon:yes stop_codon:yes gene_type:complete
MSNLKTAFSPCFIYDLLKAACSRKIQGIQDAGFREGKIKKPV